MLLSITIDDRTHQLEIPEDVLADGEDFFQKMDHDMGQGWQMGPEHVDHPTQINRCQIVADRLLVSLSAENQTMIMLMAGYILKRMPNITRIEIDTAGEMLNTKIYSGDNEVKDTKSSSISAAPFPVHSDNNKPISKFDAMEEAGKDISKIYKTGKAFRYAVRNRVTGEWIESAPIETEKEAIELRTQAFKNRYQELTAS